MKILILGGTGFLGRHLVDAAVLNHHEVTLFNRGRTSPTLFTSMEQLIGDRNRNLDALRGRRWDAVIDTCGYVSAQVRGTATLLAEAVERYVFISSISVYRDFTRERQDETAPTAEPAPGLIEEQADSATYGRRKLLCEWAIEAACPDRSLIVRPGIIVGPHDTSGRFTYWVQRMAGSGEVLAPGAPDSPVQLIDARDLAGWIVQMVERHAAGVFNATGPTISFLQMLDACKSAAQSDARLTWVTDEFLLDQKVKPFTDLPFWIPRGEKGYSGFFRVDCAKAGELGLICRPLQQTARDTKDHNTELSKTAGISAIRAREILERFGAVMRPPDASIA